MGFTLRDVVPWGRSFTEYREMFALSDTDLKRRILGCGDGPAAFNADMRRRGGRVLSVDPLYARTGAEIALRIKETFHEALDQARRNRDAYRWKSISSPERLGEVRMAAMSAFLRDYAAGRREGRYLAGALPRLPLCGGCFDLALCSHFLFLYDRQRSLDFHAQALLELIRAAGEVRVFPLSSLDGTPSPYVEPARKALAAEGIGSEIRRVPYEFQRGADEMLVVFRKG